MDAHVLPLSSSLLFGRRDFGDVVIQLKCGTSLAAVSPCFIFTGPAFSTTVRFFSKFSGTGSRPPSPADSFSRPPHPVASVRFLSSFSCCRCFLSSSFRFSPHLVLLLRFSPLLVLLLPPPLPILLLLLLLLPLLLVLLLLLLSPLPILLLLLLLLDLLLLMPPLFVLLLQHMMVAV